MHAHHVLPKKFQKEFTNAGVDINNPKYGTWMESHLHLSKAKRNNKEWATFSKKYNNPTVAKIEEEASYLMQMIH